MPAYVPYASIGTRLAAYFVDAFIYSVPVWLIMAPLLSAGAPIVPVMFIGLALAFGLLIGSEAIFGRTPAKKLFGIKVVMVDGRPIGLVSAAIRNVLRIIDHFLLIGVFVMASSARKQRIGDHLARTIVIKG
jgi:uncharacterized RDD family membrane protein YckC